MVLMASNNKVLKLGSNAPGFSLQGVDGKEHSLDDYKDNKVVLIVFMCNHCPYVKPKMDWINKLQKNYAKKGLQIIGINSKDPANYPEDSFENMIKVAKAKGFEFAYLFDSSQEVAKAYGAVCTPDPYLFDSKRKLVYHGRFDEKHGESHDTASTNEMEEAIKQVLERKEINPSQHPSMGCSIKWK